MIKLTERQIDNVIETTLLEKKINNQNYIRYSFYEINVKYPKEYGISKQDLGMFLQQLRKRLKEENYHIYTEGQEFEYDNAKRVVESNEILVAVKQ